MFFDKELKKLQEEKSRVALRCELRRRLAPIEMQSIRAKTRRSLTWRPAVSQLANSCWNCFRNCGVCAGDASSSMLLVFS